MLCLPAALQRCRNSLSTQRRHYTCTGVCGQRFQHFRRPFSRHKGPKEAGWEGRSHRHTRISGEGFRPHRLRNNSQHLLHTGQRDARRSQVTPRNPRLAGSLNPQRLPFKLRTADLDSPTKRFSIGKRNRAYVGDLDGKHSEQQEVDSYITAPSLRKLEMSGCAHSVPNTSTCRNWISSWRSQPGEVVRCDLQRDQYDDQWCEQYGRHHHGRPNPLGQYRVRKYDHSLQKVRRRRSQTVVSESSPQRWTAKHCAQSIAAWHR